MYARVLRRWSLKTKLMSYLWLVVVSILLVIICAPTFTTTTTAMAAATAQLQPTAAAAISSQTLWRHISTSESAAAAAIPATNVGVAEESFYIPVATSQEDVESNSSNEPQQQPIATQHRLLNISPSSSRSSKSKIFSNSRLLSNSFQQQQPMQPQQHADSMVYSYYFKAQAPPTAQQWATVFANGKSSPAVKVQQQQQTHVATATNRDYNEAEDDEDENAEEEEEEEEDNENVAEVEAEQAAALEAHDFAESEQHAIESATFIDNFKENHKNKQVPNVPNSQKINLYNKFTNKLQQQQQQQTAQQQTGQLLQQQQYANSVATHAAANVHSTKARRHVQQQTHSQPQQQQQQQQTAATTTSFHSPVRETVSMDSVKVPATLINAAVALNYSKHAALLKPAFRYIIEAFEIPATLPLAELTPQQRHMLLLQQQQLAARNRRDSRAFGLNIASSSSSSSSSYQQHYYNSQQQQQQQQQQPYQRLQQQLQHHSLNSNTNNNNYNYQKQQLSSNSYQHQQHHSVLQHQHQQHYNHNHHHYQQHQRNGNGNNNNKRRRYCSARDPAQLAFEAPTVFEGKIISMTPDRRANFSATVEVKEIFKQQFGFRLQKYLRLQFAYRNTSGECDIYREQLRPRGLVRGDELEQGRIYLLFVQQVDLGNFTILGQPIRKTRRVIEAVKNAVSENYAQLAAIRSITASNRTVENGKELRIVCKVQGRPPPKVTWFKDHKSINRNRRLYQIVPFKKRSELIIRSFNSSDAGRYECRAKNKVNRNLERRAIVIKAYPVPRYETHLTGGTGHSCPPDAAEFCFNGGTCKLFVEIGSYSCICPEGFIGERCDRKEVNNMPPSTYSNEQECGEKKFLGSYYC